VVISSGWEFIICVRDHVRVMRDEINFYCWLHMIIILIFIILFKYKLFRYSCFRTAGSSYYLRLKIIGTDKIL